MALKKLTTALLTLMLPLGLVPLASLPAYAETGAVDDAQSASQEAPQSEPQSSQTQNHPEAAEQSGVASLAAPAVNVSVDKTSVKSGDSITVTWTVSGASQATVTAARICGDVADGPGKVYSACFNDTAVSGSGSGSQALTVPSRLTKAYVDIQVNAGGSSTWYQSSEFAVTGMTGWGKASTGAGYYLNGSVQKGWFRVGTTWYYADSQGVAQSDRWLLDAGKWYYLGSDGAMRSGLAQINGSWYYLRPDGSMASGWQFLGGQWYFLKSSGAMATGWVSDGGKWYHLDSNGAMNKGWFKDGSTWYYLYSNGAMATGWANVAGKWYFLHWNGPLAYNWVWSGNNWYYMNPTTGVMRTGWLQLGNTWYYLRADGAMVTGTYYVDGKNSLFDSSGRWYGYGPSALYSVSDLMSMGVIDWNGYRFTYYSQSVLPGPGLPIPGRHVNSGGFVSDGDGYIVLAAAPSIPKGSVYQTPFGYTGKVYDTCGGCSLSPLKLDVYTR